MTYNQSKNLICKGPLSKPKKDTGIAASPFQIRRFGIAMEVYCIGSVVLRLRAD